jgi:CBS domain-containing protein
MDDPADPQSLLADPGDRAGDFSFLIRDRAGQFTEYFGAVLAHTGIRALGDARACQQADARWPVKGAVHAGHSVEHGRNPWGIAEIPETEKIMPETSAQEPSLPPVPATVADIMRPPLTTVHPNDHVAGAAYLMRHEAATALVVLDAQTSRPMGLITEADIVQLVADGRDADAVRIYNLMTTRLSVINATASIRDAANTMITGRFRHLPVVEDAGLIGMIDITDVCRALLDAPGG